MPLTRLKALVPPGKSLWSKEMWAYKGPISTAIRAKNVSIFGRRVAPVEFLCHTSFGLLAASFACESMMSLRGCALGAGGFMALFNMYHPNGPSWLTVKWNAVFVFINGYMIAKMVQARWLSTRLDEVAMAMYTLSFEYTGMDLVAFRELCLAGEAQEAHTGEYLVEQGQMTPYVRMIVEGHAEVLIDGKIVASVGPGNFVSELGLQSGLRLRDQVSSASIKVMSPTLKCFSWKRGALIDLLESDKQIELQFHSAISHDLVSKLTVDVGLDEGSQEKMSKDWPKQMRVEELKHIMKQLLADGKVSRHDRNMIQRYRKVHNIDEEAFYMILSTLGWTHSQYEGISPRSSFYTAVEGAAGKILNAGAGDLTEAEGGPESDPKTKAGRMKPPVWQNTFQ